MAGHVACCPVGFDLTVQLQEPLTPSSFLIQNSTAVSIAAGTAGSGHTMASTPFGTIWQFVALQRTADCSSTLRLPAAVNVVKALVHTYTPTELSLLGRGGNAFVGLRPVFQ